VALTPAAAPAIASLACTGCGAPLEIRAPGRSVVVACGACGALLDAQSADHRVIARYEEARRGIVPRIPLGARGTLKGERWEVIGYLARSATIAGVAYTWCEYLLHGPTGDIRWLTEYGGHWTLTRAASATPSARGELEVEYLGERYRHFQTARAEVTHVVGEFPWQIRTGDSAVVEDYVDPPLILSRERTKGESAWSAGEYVGPDVV
jgi:Domain of unknown function (DUF4178)